MESEVNSTPFDARNPNCTPKYLLPCLFRRPQVEQSRFVWTAGSPHQDHPGSEKALKRNTAVVFYQLVTAIIESM